MSKIRSRISPDDGDPRHGTPNGYGNLGCRCSLCCEAATAYNTGQRQQRTAKGLPPGDFRHGKPHTYSNWGCRCRSCTEAHRKLKVDSKKAATP